MYVNETNGIYEPAEDTSIKSITTYQIGVECMYEYEANVYSCKRHSYILLVRWKNFTVDPD